LPAIVVGFVDSAFGVSLGRGYAALRPPFRQWSAAMAGRMNSDLVFGHMEVEVAQDSGFSKRSTLAAEDLPK
jgi:hypothetical protein